MDKVKERLTIKNDLLRCFIGELLGTAVLVLTINSVVAQSVLHSAPNKLINVNLGVGLGIAFGIALCARISGKHLFLPYSITHIVNKDTILTMF